MRLLRAMRVSVMLVTLVGCLSYPLAQADSIYGTGSYVVPDDIPYGIYTADVDMADFAHACSFSTWTSDGTFIAGDSGIPGKSLTANISAPNVAKFITHGCTPWTRAQ